MATNTAPNANTQYVPFQPSQFTPFSFQPTFDGAVYNCTVTWNYYGQRYYLNCVDLTGTLVYCLPLIASPDNFAVDLNGGYFQTALVLRDSSKTFEITPANPSVSFLVNPAVPVVTG